MKHFLLAIISLFILTQAKAQFGGDATYDFLNITTSARVNALGGTQVGLVDSSELSLSYYNPAMLTPNMHNDISLNYIDYIADMKFGYVAYAYNLENIGTFSAGIQYYNYGKFEEADEDGERSGQTFTAADYVFNLMISRNVWNNVNVGFNLKPIFSKYEIYSSFGIAGDLGVSYVDNSGNFSAGIVAKNFGFQITKYSELLTEKEPLPFDLQVGFSQRLEHAPLRFSVAFHDLTCWSLTDYDTWTYENSDDDELYYGKSDTFLKQFLRHVIIGAEIIPTKNFIIGLGYNFQRRWTLGVDENISFVGLSGGFTIKISKFKVSYSIASYHLSGTSNTFSISTNLSEFVNVKSR